MFKKRVYFCLLLWVGAISAFAKVNAELDRTEVAVGQSFELLLTSEKANISPPDLLILEKDFTILGTSQAVQSITVNNSTRSTLQWTVTLVARKVGTFKIPAIYFGREKSDPLQIRVVSVGKTSVPHASKDFFIENTVDSTHPYVQAEVLYTLKVYYAKRIREAHLTPPKTQDLLFLEVGTRQYQAEKKGTLYQVLEKKYALFPQKSGEITLSPPLLTGIIQSNVPQTVDTLFFESTHPLEVSGSRLILHVKPAPPSFQEPWLPARRVILKESWEGLEKPFPLGQALTRNIEIIAEGVTADQIPAFVLPKIPGVNVYQEPPKTEDRFKNNQVVGTRHIKITYIPTAAGKHILPALSLAWWNTQTDAKQTASLGAHGLSIRAVVPSEVRSGVSQENPPQSQALIASRTGWPWIVSGVFFFVWLLTLFLWFKISHKHGETLPAVSQDLNLSATHRLKRRHALRQFKKACYAHNPKQAKESLLALVRIQFPGSELHDLLKYYEAVHLQKAIDVLEAALYSKEPVPWEGVTLWEAWRVAHLKQTPAASASDLPKLNPE